MGEVVMRALVDEAGLAEHFEVSSAGTANWHVGDEMDDRARDALDRAGFRGSGTPAQFATPEYLRRLDLIVVMTREHRSDVIDRCPGARDRIVLIRSVGDQDGARGLDLADPYYDDDRGFDECLAEITRSCRQLIQDLR
jgi:protein-tyrosine phosphatase